MPATSSGGGEAMTAWKFPPKAKVYEALSAFADGTAEPFREGHRANQRRNHRAEQQAAAGKGGTRLGVRQPKGGAPVDLLAAQEQWQGGQEAEAGHQLKRKPSG